MYPIRKRLQLKWRNQSRVSLLSLARVSLPSHKRASLWRRASRRLCSKPAPRSPISSSSCRCYRSRTACNRRLHVFPRRSTRSRWSRHLSMRLRRPLTPLIQRRSRIQRCLCTKKRACKSPGMMRPRAKCRAKKKKASYESRSPRLPSQS